MNLVQLLLRTARALPDAPALFHGDELVRSYGGWADRSARLGRTLRDRLGLQPGDRAGIWMLNSPEYLELLYGCWFAGLVVVPINSKLHAREAEFILRDSEAAVLFCSQELAGELEPLLADSPVRSIFVPGTAPHAALYDAAPIEEACARSVDDLAWLFYTSGTTGRPKGVMLSHGNLETMISCYFMDVDSPRGEDAVVYAAPMSHGAGMLNFPHVIAAARHIVPRSGGFEPAELVDLSIRKGPITLFAAPTMLKRLVQSIEAAKVPSDGFKTILYGGGPMYVEDIRHAIGVMGDRFVQVYGQGETPMTITALGRRHLRDASHPRHVERIASVGIAQTLVEVRVTDADGVPLPPGQTGEVVVRGQTVMKGYWKNPQATAEAIRSGWLFTGDMGCMDEDGFLTLKDRSKDMIISGGSNIYPREVEEVLLRHPDVDEVSVVGRPSTEWGEDVVAFVVTKNGRQPDPSALDALCLAEIARFKRPKQYLFVDALPKNNYGKVLKTVLREQFSRQE